MIDPHVFCKVDLVVYLGSNLESARRCMGTGYLFRLYSEYLDR